MNNDPYKEFAETYDLFQAEFGKFDDATIEEFYKDLFKEHHVHRVLDCACGTGKYIPLLYRLGCKVVGSDISEAMLAKAKQNLTSCGITAALTRADFRDLGKHFSEQFDAVVCLSTSLPHLPDEEQVLEMLKNTRRVLRTDGLLVLSQGFTDKMIRERPSFVPAINKPDFSRIFAMEYGEKTLTFNVLDLTHTKDLQETKQYRFEYQILLGDSYQRLLAQAGYHDVSLYGDYCRTPYDKETSEKLIIVAFN